MPLAGRRRGRRGGAGRPPAADVLRTRLTEAYGIRYPIVQAGMAFYATPALAAAVTNAGGLGVLGPGPRGAGRACGPRSHETRALTTGPFGVDFVYFPFFDTTLDAPGYEEDGRAPEPQRHLVDQRRPRRRPHRGEGRLRRLVLDGARGPLGRSA